MTQPTVIFVVLDAFRWDYLDPVDTPLMWEWTRSGVYAQRLITSSGFTQRSAMFCGTYPDRTGNFAMFSFDPDGSPFAFLRPHLFWLRAAQRYIETGWRGSGWLSRGIRQRLIAPRASRFAAHAPSANIPLSLLPWIGVTEDRRPIHEGGALGVESVFDLLLRKGLSFRYLMFPEVNCEDDVVLDKALAEARSEIPFVLLQFSDSDLLCHAHGPESIVRRKVTAEMDRKLRALQRAFKGGGRPVCWLIVGDHGMMDVERSVDVAAVVHGRARQRGWRHGRDYLLFLDSTLARLWALRAAFRSDLAWLLDDPALMAAGAHLTAEAASASRIPWGDRRYGDCIWRAQPGTLIRPDYFHPTYEPVRGMHGYDPHHEKMQGFALLCGEGIPPRTVRQIQLVDICPTLCDLLGLPHPAGNEGVSLLRGASRGVQSSGRGAA